MVPRAGAAAPWAKELRLGYSVAANRPRGRFDGAASALYRKLTRVPKTKLKKRAGINLLALIYIAVLRSALSALRLFLKLFFHSHFLRKNCLSESERYRCNLEKLVILDEFHTLLKAEHAVRHESESIIRA